MILYSTVNVYTVIMINCPIGYLSGSVGRTREYITFIVLSTALLFSNPVCHNYYCNYFFHEFFLLFALSFIHFIQFDLYGDNNILTLDP